VCCFLNSVHAPGFSLNRPGTGLPLAGLALCFLPALLFAAGNSHKASKKLVVKTVPLSVSTKAEITPSRSLAYSLKSPKIMQSTARVSANGLLSKECADVATHEKSLLVKDSRKEVLQ